MRNILMIAMTLMLFNIISPGSQRDNRNHKFKEFSLAKKAVFTADVEKKTFYCGCPYNERKEINLQACGYQFRKSRKRASKVEIEHVVPADKLCGQTPEWKSGSEKCVDSNGRHFKGRKCASRYNPVCVMAYNDIENLRPAIGEINNDRSDYSFAEIKNKETSYGTCRFFIKNGVVDPPENVHGDIARIYLHMNATYPELNLSAPDEIKLFQKWSGLDPATEEECRKNKKIHDIQGTYNFFILEQCGRK
ncbi:MAG: endonuclease [Spirochaetia bacterium]|nr:endonuclease [Spirochaetia bacterium]